MQAIRELKDIRFEKCVETHYFQWLICKPQPQKKINSIYKKYKNLNYATIIFKSEVR